MPSQQCCSRPLCATGFKPHSPEPRASAALLTGSSPRRASQSRTGTRHPSSERWSGEMPTDAAALQKLPAPQRSREAGAQRAEGKWGDPGEAQPLQGGVPRCLYRRALPFGSGKPRLRAPPRQANQRRDDNGDGSCRSRLWLG